MISIELIVNRIKITPNCLPLIIFYSFKKTINQNLLLIMILTLYFIIKGVLYVPEGFLFRFENVFGFRSRYKMDWGISISINILAGILGLIKKGFYKRL